MKALYALASICLSLPAFASNLDLNHQPYEAAETACFHDLADDFDVLGENTAAITVPATPESEEVWAEIWLAPDSSPSSEPREVGASDVATEHTATVPAVKSSDSEEVWDEIWLEPDSSPEPRAVGANDFAAEHTATIPAVEPPESGDASDEIRFGSASPTASQPDAGTSIVNWDDE
jgi:hypothetical protein